MKYENLAKVYEQLESTTKKLEKAEIVAKFLKAAPSKLLPIVALLVQGRIFPAWTETELGVAENIMIKALVKVTGLNENDVKKEITKKGDIGLAVEELVKRKKQRTLMSRELTVERVYENFQKIPKQTGSGSIEVKLSILADLLSSASAKEAKYIVRSVMEEMRVGVGEGIVRNSIAKAFKVSKEDVEWAYNVRNDYGEVAVIAKKEGADGLRRQVLEIGRPLKPMLAQKVESAEKGLGDMGGVAAFEFKYDGLRIQLHKKGNEVTVYTRRLDNVSKQFPELVEAARKCLNADKCIVEGEAVGIDPSTRKPQAFQRLSQRIKRKYGIEEMRKEIPVEMNLFDIMYLNGESLISTPLEERWEKLKGIVKENEDFHLAEHLVTKDVKEAEEFFDRAVKDGHEGLMVKNLESVYTPGSRVKHMYKLKPEKESLDLVVIGAIWGEGRRTDWMGSFVLGAREPDTGEFVEVGKVATGLTDADLEKLTNLLKPYIIEEHIKSVKLKPHLVIEVGYEEIQKSPKYESGFALRFPRVRQFRDDKGPADADSIERVSRLFEKQKGL